MDFVCVQKSNTGFFSCEKSEAASVARHSASCNNVSKIVVKIPLAWHIYCGIFSHNEGPEQRKDEPSANVPLTYEKEFVSDKNCGVSASGFPRDHRALLPRRAAQAADLDIFE